MLLYKKNGLFLERDKGDGEARNCRSPCSVPGPVPYALSKRKTSNPNPKTCEIAKSYGPNVHFWIEILRFSFGFGYFINFTKQFTLTLIISEVNPTELYQGEGQICHEDFFDVFIIKEKKNWLYAYPVIFIMFEWILLIL